MGIISTARHYSKHLILTSLGIRQFQTFPATTSRTHQCTVDGATHPCVRQLDHIKCARSLQACCIPRSIRREHAPNMQFSLSRSPAFTFEKSPKFVYLNGYISRSRIQESESFIRTSNPYPRENEAGSYCTRSAYITSSLALIPLTFIVSCLLCNIESQLLCLSTNPSVLSLVRSP